MHKFKYFIIPTLVSLASCVTVSEFNSQLEQRYFEFLNCVHQAAAPKIKRGSTPRKAVKEGIKECKREQERYVNAIINKTKRDNNWNSVKPEVTPSVRTYVVKQTESLLTRGYRKP